MKHETCDVRQGDHLLISQQHQWGKVQTKVSYGQPRQDKARVRKADT